ncbi:MAG: hypothetical protein ACRDTT_36610, partial [Pseudonocardiaceae bacterium]
LDLDALCARLLPKDRINRIRYFTATVSARPDNPDAPQRQQVYLRALETIPDLSIHYGHYLTHVTRMPLAEPAAAPRAHGRGREDRGEGLRCQLGHLPAGRRIPGRRGHRCRIRCPCGS